MRATIPPVRARWRRSILAPMEREEFLRAELVRVSRALHARGWVANHDGNVTALLRWEEGGARVLSTPTATSKAAVTPESLIVVDGEGARVSGTRQPFSELKLHLPAYRLRAAVGAVGHAHPPHACAFAAAGEPLGAPFMAEPVVSIGPEVPLLPFGLPGDPALTAALEEALTRADVFLLSNHGVLAVGPDPDLCLLRIELVEHLARVALAARPLGGPKALPADVVEALAAKHSQLFPRDLRGGSDGARPAPAAAGWAPSPAAPAGSPMGSAGDIVAAALKRMG
jgi:L-fuculose-phosphate aldolase